jgi:hypothetical protein
MPIVVTPSDLIPLGEFRLRWRWTDPRWKVLPTPDLAAIQPLTADKASEVFARTMPLFVEQDTARRCSGGAPDELRSAVTEVPAKRRTTEVGVWLQSLAGDESVIVSWDRHTAVLTPWRVFCMYWDDFCYPGSDNVAVVPPSGEWLLWYHHEERFIFWALRAGRL